MTTKKTKADVSKAVIVLQDGAAKLSGIAATAARDTGNVTKGMVAVWKPLLTFTESGKVIEGTDEFKAMRLAFREGAHAGQDVNPLFTVEYRKVDHGSGVKVWTERSDIDAPADVIDKLDAFTYTPKMRAHDLKKVSADLKAQVYKVQKARLDNNERQAFNNFKAALNKGAINGSNEVSWDSNEWKRIESHYNKRFKDGNCTTSLAEVRAAYADLIDLLGY